jgi:hypothetical protein
LYGKDGAPPIKTESLLPIDKLSLPLKRALLAEVKAINQGADFGGKDSPFVSPKAALDK